MQTLAIRHRTTGTIYRFQHGVWHGPESQRIRLTPIPRDVALVFLESPNHRYSASAVQEKVSGTWNPDDPSQYRKHIAKVNELFGKVFGVELIETLQHAGVQSGDSKSHFAEYRLSSEFEVLGEELVRQPDTTTFLERYKEALTKSPEWGAVRSVVSSEREIALEDAYVEVFLRPLDRMQLLGFSGDDWLEEQERVPSLQGSHEITVESLLARANGTTILTGLPGSGKTTTLKWICAYLLENEGNETVPIPVFLGDFAAALASGTSSGLVEHAMQSVLGHRAPMDGASVLTSSETFRSAVFLLDGWDEVPRHLRSGVLKQIELVSSDHSVVVTTRVNALSFLTRSARAAVFELNALADDAVADLCEHQARALGRLNQLPNMLRLIENSPGLWSLTSNPFLLTLFCEVVLTAQEMPVAVVVSPLWVLTSAVELIRSSYNASHPENVLHRRDIERVLALAGSMSFGHKRITFEPVAEFPDLSSSFGDSALGRSRFFSAVGAYSTSYSFVHLRIQEFLAAKWATGERDVDVDWIARMLQSRVWQEEAQFALATLLQRRERVAAVHDLLREFVLHPDEAGDSIRSVAGVLTTAGSRDGGKSMLGVDIREVLWERIVADDIFSNEDTQALAQLDPEYLLVSMLAFNRRDDALMSQMYRFIPLGIRRTKVDPILAKNPALSWMIGLAGRGFARPAELEDLGDRAAQLDLPDAERIRALRDLGSARARSQVRRVVDLMGDRSDDVANAAIETLSKIGGREAAVAIAQSLIKINQATVRRTPDFVTNLYNALAEEGYGLLEPHSRDVLVDFVDKPEKNVAALDIALAALKGAQLPAPPRRLLDILAQQDKETVAMRETAAAALGGITDPEFLDDAIDLLRTEPEGKVRRVLLSSIPFVPVGSPHVEYVWSLCRASQTREASLALRLIFRTVARYPQHPMGEELSDFVDKSLARLAGGTSCSGLQQQILRESRAMASNDGLKSALLRVLGNEALDLGCLTLGAEALASQRLVESDYEAITRQFAHVLEGDSDAAPLAGSLAVILFAQERTQGPSLLSILRSRRDRLGDGPSEMLLKAAHRSGHLLYVDHVVFPDGTQEGHP